MGEKRLKDPIYGYISIDSSIMEGIVDTAEFQRLRNVIQTSFSPLYSSAVHNRFVHSMGVYYLGKILSDSILENVSQETRNDVPEMDRLFYVFQIACLLHDVGHAPFSHTGEDLYISNKGKNELHKEIIELTQDSDLGNEISRRKDNFAAPHELMSVIVALKIFPHLFKNDEEKSFFARCILGYLYSIKKDTKHSFMNCVISMLNSSVIDVDKLDYLIRDAYITGFDTVSIDYIRLLRCVTFLKSNDEYDVVYKKGAISVIENVVYAHDAEKKWIQTHPVVLYESYLLQKSMKLLFENSNNKLFSYEALSKEGIEISEGSKVSLLSDADIVYLMKNLASEAVDEYFCRKQRRHSLWKSESEYKAIFLQGFDDEDFSIVENRIVEVCKFCNTDILNQSALEQCQKSIEDMKEMISQLSSNNDNFKKDLSQKEQYLEWLEALKNFADGENIDFSFVVLSTKQFNSGFSTPEFSKIRILFEAMKKPCEFTKVTNVLKADQSDRKNYFYMYYKVPNNKHKINVNNLAIELGKVARNERLKEMTSKFEA